MHPGLVTVVASRDAVVHFVMMRDVVRVFSSFREAEEAERTFYTSLSPQERLDVLLELVARHSESMGEDAKRLERVYRVVELSRR